MLPVLLELGKLKVYSYGLMLALGFIVGGYLYRRELKRYGLSPDLGDWIIMGALIGGIFGAKVYSVIEGLKELGVASLKDFFSGAGLVWYGGLIGGTIAVIIVMKTKHAPMMQCLDIIAPLLILGYAFGRMGCFLSGDGDYGPPSDLPWAMAFPNGTVPTLVKVHPTPLYEIIFCLAIFAFLWRIRKRNLHLGWMFGMYLILSGVERFITEFWRVTQKVLFDSISMAQIIGIFAIIIGIILILHSKNMPINLPLPVSEKPINKSNTQPKNQNAKGKGKKTR
jgi:phosphatidylglycerol---prolipoprotein diacylglyceryl transferase